MYRGDNERGQILQGFGCSFTAKIEKTFLNLLFFYQLQSVIRTRLCKRRQNVNKKEAEEVEGKEVTEFIV